MKKTVAVSIFILLLLCSNLNVSGSTNNNFEPVELKIVSAWPVNEDSNIGMFVFQKNVAEIGNGKVTIKVIGGPETIPSFELAEAVGSGSIDMGWTVGGYYSTYVPEANILDYTEHSFSVLMENGGMDYLNQIMHEKLNVHLVGLGGLGFGYSIYTRVPIYTLEDIKGKRIRTSGTYLPFLQALGAEPVMMPSSEVYGAMQHGVIDGFGHPTIGVVSMNLHEVIKYAILPNFWQSTRGSMINLDKWNSLTEDVKDILIESARKTEEDLIEIGIERHNEEVAEMKEVGIEFITIKEDEVFLQLAKEAAIDFLNDINIDNLDKLTNFFFN